MLGVIIWCTIFLTNLENTYLLAIVVGLREHFLFSTSSSLKVKQLQETVYILFHSSNLSLGFLERLHLIVTSKMHTQNPLNLFPSQLKILNFDACG